MIRRCRGGHVRNEFHACWFWDFFWNVGVLLRREGWRDGGDRRLTYSDRWIKGWGRKVCKQAFVIQEVKLQFSKICHWSGCMVCQTEKYSYYSIKISSTCFSYSRHYSQKTRRRRILNYAMIKQGCNDVGLFNGNATLIGCRIKGRYVFSPVKRRAACMRGDGLPGTVKVGSTSCGHQPGTSCQPGISAHSTLSPTSRLNCRIRRQRPRFHKNTAHSLFCGKFVIFLHAVRWSTNCVTLNHVGSAQSEHGIMENTHTHSWGCAAMEKFSAALSETCLRGFKSIGCHVCTFTVEQCTFTGAANQDMIWVCPRDCAQSPVCASLTLR